VGTSSTERTALACLHVSLLLYLEQSVREMVALTHRTCDARIANGELLERMLTFKSPSFAFGCTIGGEDEHFGDVSIRSSASINRALPGDIVAIRVLDQPKEAIDDAGHTSDDEAATGVTGASQEEEATDLSASRPELAGEVVSILVRSHATPSRRTNYGTLPALHSPSPPCAQASYHHPHHHH